MVDGAEDPDAAAGGGERADAHTGDAEVESEASMDAANTEPRSEADSAGEPSASGGDGEQTAAEAEAATTDAPEPGEGEVAGTAESSGMADTGAVADAGGTPDAGRTADAAQPADFMRDLVDAMRRVAEQAREAGLADLRTRADEQVTRLGAASEQRVAELRTRADADVTGIGEWAKAEAERIRAEADARVAARRGQLDQELATEEQRAEGEAQAIRGRVAEYERELEAFHAQLASITDPAAFAAAAKRIPPPPPLTVPDASRPAGHPRPAAAATPAGGGREAVTASATTTPHPAATNGGEPIRPGPADMALAARLAQSSPSQTRRAGDQAAPAPTPTPAAGRESAVQGATAPTATAPTATAPTGTAAVTASTSTPTADAGGAAESGVAVTQTTSIVVKGLASFGAITGFRQALAGVEGIEAVQLSLGPTGEFVYRATHAEGFDVADAITKLEGDGTQVARDEDGTLRVSIPRAR
jgi:hypothetical protein